MAQQLRAENWQASLAARVTLRRLGSLQWQDGRLPTLRGGAPAAGAICSQGSTASQGSEASGHPSAACTSLVTKATDSHG